MHNNSFPYRAEIDGLRALAVLSVIFFHAGFPGFSGGYVGVDIFFVISGYLITSIILREKMAGTFSLMHFYERRARRILPALFFVILACLPFAWLWLPPGQLKSFSLSVISVCFFISNIFFWRTSGYFDQTTVEKPLLHTWSLGVEEQYYLLFPLLVLLLWKKGPKRLLWTILFLSLFSFGLSEFVLAKGKTEANFLLTPMRAWELFIGCLLALLAYMKSLHELVTIQIKNIASLLGLVFIFIAIFSFSAATPFPSAYALLPTLGTALIIACAVDNTIVQKMLSTRLLVSIGLISYSAYLWHHPLFAFARIYYFDQPPPIIFLGLSILTLGLAFITQRFIESPFRHNKIISRKSALLFCAGGATFFIFLSGAAYATHGFKAAYEARLDPKQLIIYHKLESAINISDYQKMVDDQHCKFWAKVPTAAFRKRYQECYSAYGKAVLILGDSHAMDLYDGLAYQAPSPFVVGIVQAGCRPHTPLPECDYAAIKQFIVDYKQTIRVAFYTQSGGYYLTRNMRLPISEDFVEMTYDYLTELAKSISIIWLGPQAELMEDLRSANLIRHKFVPHVKKEITQVDDYLAEFVSQRPNSHISYLSKLKLTHFQPERDFFYQDNYTYSNEDHWSSYGEKIFGERLVSGEALAKYLAYPIP